ncbi:cytochrome b/b6 domain-containing protein [Campylobacter sp. RM9344]|uniref:Cytochrome b/b6 domain-containing protein n=1 Tax=Campylobacter californiensis TaxID=1032243 RepID=A0AAW3ZX00_9BACT|nr:MULTISPECIES: cytochrome b/b6 domain-containing protein [unclassified Campylobacter]MBE2984174.1 cytochrome b/b6 domain-containing protein [Campylobacter sp. RM6883]MBE2986202.1 cytochrome b/b6 domain-containing protein [Campylobacter sp. RM12919]MBE2988199.1 cytochrome b/b6 domain-containing protein [Campylobacter sp. RM12920]MBE2995543.1 cytochrome b/b6 domain-containing protein [Campylobacter sp. RM6913]MBE3029788.1 cytochrome b/b6 domain-containing protein [Campylobacter sp. RM9344]
MNDKVIRQSLQNRIIHWGIAFSIFGLIVTGILQMPVAKRYNITKVFEWSGDYFFTLNLHYIFSATLIFFSFYHIFYHGLKREFDIVPRKADIKNSYLVIKAMIKKDKEPPSPKYLPEQRIAYAAAVFIIALLIVTGLIKAYKNLLGFDISNSLYTWAATLHNVGLVLIILFIIAHLIAFVPKANRALLGGMFSGKIDKKYAKHRHSLWKIE